MAYPKFSGARRRRKSVVGRRSMQFLGVRSLGSSLTKHTETDSILRRIGHRVSPISEKANLFRKTIFRDADQLTGRRTHPRPANRIYTVSVHF